MSSSSSRFIGFFSKIRSYIKDLKYYIKIMHGEEILRRYFIMNAYDGALTMLGIVLGAVMSGAHDAKIIVGASISASFAMGISGFVGAFMTEKAERERLIKELERALLTDLDNTVLGKASLAITIMAALTDGISPMIPSLIGALPFILVMFNMLTFIQAVYISLGIVVSTLIILGVLLGRISRESIIKYVLIMLSSGFLVALLSLIFGFR